MVGHAWTPIKPISEHDRGIDLSELHPLYEAWRDARVRLEQSSPLAFARFNQRLVRSLSIETGILERLYDLDRGTTEVLVAHGFMEDLVHRSSTDIEPARLIDILRDQEAAIQLVMDCVAGERQLGKSLIHELHALLTRHQGTTMAVDPLGHRHEIPLRKGAYKQQPNNPKRTDETVHEYCPPVHVEAEMDNLLAWLPDYQDDDPLLVTAWLHHRFTQIHPYQDGNGRVGRALTTLTMLRAGLLPLVIDRDMRVEYINALERADGGELEFLVTLFARLERAAILRALSIDADTEIAKDRLVSSAVIERLAARWGRRKQRQREQLRRVDALAESLRSRARTVIAGVFGTLEQAAATIATPEVVLHAGGPDRDNAHWYRREVIQTSKRSGTFVNFDEAHYFIKATFRAEVDRLVFVVSFHHVGRELSGIMECTAFALLESYDEPEARRPAFDDFHECSLEPFVLTWNTREADIAGAFERWLDRALAVAIKEFGDRL